MSSLEKDDIPDGLNILNQEGVFFDHAFIIQKLPEEVERRENFANMQERLVYMIQNGYVQRIDS